MTSKMRSAAILAATGTSAEDIAAQLDVSVRTVKDWLRRDDFIKELESNASTYIRAAAPMAQQLLIKQVNDPNEWVAQNAAREVIRLAQLERGASTSNVQVSFGDMPEPGMPSDADIQD